MQEFTVYYEEIGAFGIKCIIFTILYFVVGLFGFLFSTMSYDNI